jgi:hypothetical protein
VKAALEQLLDSGLGFRTPERREEGVPLGCDLVVGRQAVHVDQMLGL